MTAPMSPRAVALDLGFDLTGNNSPSWVDLADLAFAAYWKARPAASRPALVEHRLRQKRATTPPEVWMRRAGEVA